MYNIHICQHCAYSCRQYEVISSYTVKFLWVLKYAIKMHVCSTYNVCIKMHAWGIHKIVHKIDIVN